jgi:hypothetical protein
MRHESDPQAISDRVVTKRLGSGDTAAFVRLRVDNRGRSTARNVAVRVLKVHRWEPATGEWVRLRPELDGRLLQPSNHLPSEPNLIDVFPYSDRIVDLASVDLARASDGADAMYVEISQPWPPNAANLLDSAIWRLELLVCGDNIRAERSFVTVSFDGTWPAAEHGTIWEHFAVHAPSHSPTGNADPSPG